MKKFTAVLLAFSLFMLSGCNNAVNNASSNPQNDGEIRKTVNLFLKSLKNKDVNQFKELTLPEGIVFVRGFVSGNGTRGADIYETFKQNEIPSDFKLPVNKELPEDLINETFKQSLNTDYEKIPVVVNKSNTNLNKNVTSPNAIWDKVSNFIPRGGNTAPVIIKTNDNFILFDQSESEFNTLTAALFNKIGEKYYLHLIIDYR